MATKGFTRTRPGGAASTKGTATATHASSGGGSGGILQSILDFFNPTKPIPGTDIGGVGSGTLPGLPSLPNLNPFSGVETAINDTTDFLKLMAWIFHPVNWLRAVEFLTGIALMLFGINLMFKFSESARGWPGPFGNAARRSRGARQGRQAGQRQEARSKSYRETRTRENQRNTRKATKRVQKTARKAARKP